MHLFISYAKNDTRDLALALADALNALDGVTAWVDKTLRAGKSWELQIQNEIDRCDTMIVLYSPDINRHKLGLEESYVLTEIRHASRIAKKRILAVMAIQTDPPMSLAFEQYIDFATGDLTLADLVDALCDQLGVIPSPTKPKTLDEALERARSFMGKRNCHWTPFITTFPDLKIPDMPFCLVPVGSFQMGADDRDEAKPAHPQTITQPYYIAQFSVTNAQWALGVKAGVVKEPEEYKPMEIAAIEGIPSEGIIIVKLPVLEWYHDPTMADVPVAGVSWFEVKKFVDWLGCRLPTELEWEYAARGVESWGYPWGNDREIALRRWFKDKRIEPYSVSSRPEDTSWVGACQLSDNVCEWTSSLFKPYPYRIDDGREPDSADNTDARRVLRGSHWNYGGILHFSVRDGNAPQDSGDYLGFRCARSL